MTLRTLNYGNDGIFLIMGNAGFCPSTVSPYSRCMIIVQYTPELFSNFAGPGRVVVFSVWGLRAKGLTVRGLQKSVDRVLGKDPKP